MRLLLLLLLSFALLALRSHAASVVVHLRNGTVRGSSLSFGGKAIGQFLGIPYAEPPVGHLRFSPPRALQAKWKEPLSATAPPSRCPQVPFLPITLDAFLPEAQIPRIDENCLFLNIWTPLDSKRKPVLVWIHEGAFARGDGFPTHNGLALAALEDVIVVTFNYRLGVLGFLRLNESVAGNWGLMDQQMALQWLQENIAAFGGDPEQVTIFGESAGGSSAALHLFNTESARLFRRAVVQSASSFNVRAMNIHPFEVAEAHQRFAAFIGCDSTDEASVLACLREKSASDLTEKQMEFSTDFIWCPVLDGKFIKGRPEEMRAANKEVMLGVCEDEGGLFLDKIQKSLAKTHPGNDSLDLLTDNVFDFIRTDYFPHRPSTPALQAMRTFLRSHADPQNRTAHLRRMSDALGNTHPLCGVNKLADHLAGEGGVVFVFEFAHRPSYSRFADFVGATHWDDVAFVFDLLEVHPAAFNASKEEKALARRMMKEIATFARTGQPFSDNWRRFSVEKKEFFRFAMTSGPQTGGLHREECAFWTEILPQIERLESKLKEAERTSDKLKFLFILSVLFTILAIELLYRLLLVIRRFNRDCQVFFSRNRTILSFLFVLFLAIIIALYTNAFGMLQ